MDLPRLRRGSKKIYRDVYPQGILDIIQTEYPERYVTLTEGSETLRSLESMFSEEEWLDILAKSRLSYEQWSKLKKQKLRTIK